MTNCLLYISEPQVLKPEEHTEDASVLSDGVHIVSPTVAVELPQLEITKGTDLATERMCVCVCVCVYDQVVNIYKHKLLSCDN